MSRLRLSSPVLDQVLRLGTLAAVLLIGGLGAAVPAAVAAPTDMVDLGQASTYAVLSGASVGNTVNARRRPAHHAPGRPRRQGRTRSPPAFRPAWSPARPASATPPPPRPTPTSSRPTPRSPVGTGGTPLAGDLAGLTLAPGLHSTAAAVSNTGTVTLDGGGDPNAVFVFKVGGALTMAAGSPRHADQRRPGVACVLAGQRRRRRRRERQVRGNADGARRGRDGCRHGGQRPRARPQRRDLARLQRVLQRPARGHDRRRGHARSRPTRPRRSAARPTSRHRASSP